MFGRVSPLVSCSAFVNWSDCWCQHLFTSLPSNRFLSSPVKPLVLDGWTTKQQIRLAIVFLLLFVIICFGFVVGRYFWIAVHCFTSSIQSLEPFISIDDSWYSCVCFCLFLFVFVCYWFWSRKGGLEDFVTSHHHPNSASAPQQHQHCWRSFTCGRDSRMNRVLWAHPASNNSISGFLFFNSAFSFFIYSFLTKWSLFFLCAIWQLSAYRFWLSFHYIFTFIN